MAEETENGEREPAEDWSKEIAAFLAKSSEYTRGYFDGQNVAFQAGVDHACTKRLREDLNEHWDLATLLNEYFQGIGMSPESSKIGAMAIAGIVAEAGYEKVESEGVKS